MMSRWPSQLWTACPCDAPNRKGTAASTCALTRLMTRLTSAAAPLVGTMCRISSRVAKRSKNIVTIRMPKPVAGSMNEHNRGSTASAVS